MFHLLEVVLNPFFLGLLLLLAGFFYLLINGKGFWLRSAFALSIMLLLICSTGFLPKFLIHHLEQQYPPVYQIDPSISWIVVLGGGQASSLEAKPNDRLSTASLRRSIEGLRLYQKIPGSKILLSGGDTGAGISEAQTMKQWLLDFVPEKDIFLEENSKNTIDQAKEVKKSLRNQRFYLVTSAVHMPRTMHLFKKQGLHALPAPTDFTYYWSNRMDRMLIPNPNNIIYFNISMHEIGGQMLLNLF